MSEKELKTIDDLTPDAGNFNRHTEFGQKLLEDSLRKFGAGRSILVDKDGNIIAGNSTTETAAAIGMEDVIVVPTDGKKLVVVQRTDLSLDSPEGRELALADNMTALKGIDIDLAKVQETLGDDLAKAWGMDLTPPELPDKEMERDKEMEEEFKRRMAAGEDLLEDEEYLEWLEKHQAKKTTDDCYTPPEVFDCVRDFATSLIDMDGRQIVRPFYPHGDFENEKYPENCVVIDNPPFSIITKIVKWYEERGIKYFLFAPHLTCFGARASCTILTDANVKYENGAVVKTSFVTNFIDEPKVWGCIDLKNRLNAICNLHEHPTERKIYPRNATNSALFGRYLSRGIEFKIPKDECVYIGNLDEMKDAGMRIFGGGILLSDRVADELENKKEGFERVVHLSEREKEMVEELSIIGKRKELK